MPHSEHEPTSAALTWTASTVAERLGAVQEARRVRESHTGTEHLLLACCADPTIRRRLAELGADLSTLQARARPATISAPPARPPLTATARRTLEHLDPDLDPTLGTDRDRDLETRARSEAHGGPPDPAARSWLLRRLLHHLVTDPSPDPEHHPSAARTLLGDLVDLDALRRLATQLTQPDPPAGRLANTRR